MKYLSAFMVSIHGILAHKLRSFLTILGVAIGIGSIISMMAVGEGSEKSVTEDFTAMGSNLLYVVPGAGFMGLVSGAEGSARTLTYNDALAMAESDDITAVKHVMPESSTRSQLISERANTNAQIIGVNDAWFEARDNKELASGEFYTSYDIENKTMVCVLGSNLAADLFEGPDPVGQRVRAAGRTFTVVGHLESDGESFFSTTDNTMIIPITTMMYRINPRLSTRGEHLVSSIGVEAVSEKKVDDAIEEITLFLRERHELGPGERDDFTIYNQQEYLDMQTETSDTLKSLLTYVAIFALIIAGIGIMNIMLVSVTERTREIGIRKAVGAKRRHILIQFLLEATTISVIGGLLGIGVGYLLSEFVFTGFEINQMTMTQSTIDPIVTFQYIWISFLVAVGIGIVSGTYPAIRASRLNPIEALRYE